MIKLKNIEDLAVEIQRIVPSDDNIKLDMTEACQLIQKMKLSFQIEFILQSEEIVNYLKTNEKRYFSPPPSFKASGIIPNEKDLKAPFLGVEFYFHISPHDNTKESKYTAQYIPGFYVTYTGKYITSDDCIPAPIIKSIMSKCVLFDLFNNVTPYKSLYESSKFFNIEPFAFSKVGMIHKGVKLTMFCNTDEHSKNAFELTNPDMTYAEHVEFELNRIIEREPDLICNGVYSHVFEANQKQVYDYRDKYNLIQMKMIKKYKYIQNGGTTKAYLPLTNWMFLGCLNDRLMTIPLPTEQPLFNLQHFDACEYVVICPNIEIADKLQREKTCDNVVFTSFVCNHGYYSQVDFSELKGKHVVLLLVNYSGIEIEDAVVESKGLYNYLESTKAKIKYTELKCIQTAVKYNIKAKNILSMRDYVNHYEEPTIIPNSTFIIESKEEYESNCAKAEKQIQLRNKKPKFYWEKDLEEVTIIDERTCGVGPVQLMRGTIARGCLTFFMGESGIGKTNFMTSICAYLVNNSQRAIRPIAERYWTRCQTKMIYDRLKILYLDFDNPPEYIGTREKMFIDPYMPDDPQEKKACKENFIIKSMTGDSTKYSLEENFNIFCDLLDDYAANRGKKGQPIDILVIDTYWKFIQESETKCSVFKMLKQKYPDMAIVVLHHLNKDEKCYGRMDKLFDADTAIYLSRDGKDGTLNSPFTVQIKNKKRLIYCDEDLEPFQVRYDDNKHFVVVNPKDDETTVLRRIYKGYKGKTKTEIANLLGMSLSSLSKKLDD